MNNLLSLNMKCTWRPHLYILIILSLLIMGLGGCSGSDGQDLFETARFEEQQNNQTHARELYQQIIREYPKGEFAKKAQDRLAQLNQAP